MSQLGPITPCSIRWESGEPLPAIGVVAPHLRRGNRRAAPRAFAEHFVLFHRLRDVRGGQHSMLVAAKPAPGGKGRLEAVYGACGESPKPPSHSGCCSKKLEGAHRGSRLH